MPGQLFFSEKLARFFSYLTEKKDAVKGKTIAVTEKTVTAIVFSYLTATRTNNAAPGHE